MLLQVRDIVLTMNRPDKLVWRDVFLPFFHEDHLQAKLRPVRA
jgi:hypothetical protein